MINLTGNNFMMKGGFFSELRLTAILIVVGVLFSNFNFAEAASYGVTPMIIDIKAEARDIIKKSVTVTNESDQKIDLYPVVNNVLVDESGVQKFQNIQEADKSTSLANWIQFPRAVIELESGESKTIVFSIQVNIAANPGVYHARISLPEGSTREKAELSVDESPFVMVNLEVTERVNELLELKKFLPSKNFFLNLPASLFYSIENVGNKEVVPRGEVIIYDRKGKEIGNVAINVEGKTVSPGNVLDLKSDFSEGKYFGKYKAFLNINYGNNQRATINDTIYFYIIPWQKLSIVFSIIVVMVWVFSIWLHRRGNNVATHSGQMSHMIFHESHHANHRKNRYAFYEELKKEVHRGERSESLGLDHVRNKNQIVINGKRPKNHNDPFGHVMDLRHHKKK